MEDKGAARLLVSVNRAFFRTFVDVGDGQVDAESVGMEINAVPHDGQLSTSQGLAFLRHQRVAQFPHSRLLRTWQRIVVIDVSAIVPSMACSENDCRHG